MALHLSCPECGAQFDLIQAMENTDGRRLLDTLKDMPPVVIRPFFRYLKLFKPVKQGMRWSRMLTLTQELLPMIKEAQVTRNGVTYAVPPAQWAEAMNNLVDTPPPTLKLPLKGHGYLLSILAGTAEKTAAQAERKTEERKRHRGRDTDGGDQVTPAHAMDHIDDHGQRNSKPEGWVKNKLLGNPEEAADE